MSYNVVLHTSLGKIKLKLEKDKTPLTTENFLNYVKSGFYDNTIFHRVIDGFMIQGGGLDDEMNPKPNNDSIPNEAKNAIKNKRGTISMARTSDPHSASSQFFINTEDNDFLDFQDETVDGYGYCAFGKVIEGMDVVDKISKLSTTSRNGHDDVPVEVVYITKAEIA